MSTTSSLPTRLDKLEAALGARCASSVLVDRVEQLEELCLRTKHKGKGSLIERISALETITFGTAVSSNGPGRTEFFDMAAEEAAAAQAVSNEVRQSGRQQALAVLPPSTSYRRLYFSHLLSQFGDRMWKFAIPVLFISVWEDNLKPAAVFGFLLYGIKLLFLPMVGRGIDETDRLRLVKAATFGQNFCISASVLLLAWLSHRVQYLHSDPESREISPSSGPQVPDVAPFPGSVFDALLFVVLIVIGIVGDLCATAGTIGIEKDWVVVIAAGNSAMLTFLNSTMRRIDLFCKLVAPLFFGILMAQPSTAQGRVALGVTVVFLWSVLSVMPIYWAWKSVYYEYPALQTVKPPKPKESPFSILAKTGAVYVNHPVFGASFAYCCLYFTVLSDHHPLTTAFLQMNDVSTATLGLARAGGAFTGILGTYLFPVLKSRLGLVRGNVVAAWGFVLCIVPVSLVDLPGDTVGLPRANAMLFAIVISRVCLWCFDLANVETMQEAVAESSRGEVNAAQIALCQLMELVMATLAICFSSTFRILIFASAAGVTAAAVSITAWATRHSQLGETLQEPLHEMTTHSST